MPSGGQDAAAAAGGGTGGDDGTAASSSASRSSRRKHRSSRSPTKTTAGNTSTRSSSSHSPDNLLDKVGAACEQHQKTLHDPNPMSSDNIKSFAQWNRPTMFASDETLAAAQDDMPRKCFKQMNSLCQVLIKIEETYATKLGKIDRVLDDGHRMAAADALKSASSASVSAGDDDSAAAAAAAAQASLEEAAKEMAEQPVGWGTDDDDMLNTAKVSADLCVTYRACLRGSFCPYSLQMFGWGRGGDKVLPRVHLLLQSLLSPCVTVQTLRQISKNVRAEENAKKAKKKQPDADSSTGKNGSTKENTEAQDDGIDTLIDISQTIARLLRCIPERELRSATVRDLVALLYDSAVVIGPACPLPLVRDVAGAFAAENGNQGNAGSGTGVRLSLFGETLEERRKNASPSGADDGESQYGDDQYQVDIKSMIALLSLQRGAIRTLATLLQLHRRDRDFRVGRDEEADEGQIEVTDIEASLQSNGRRYLESASVEDAGLKDTIVASLRQVLLSPAALSSATATDHASGEVCVLRLLAKIEGVRLLQLLWEDLSTLESTSQNDETTDLRLLCCQALLAHFQAMGDTPSDETSSSTISPNVRAVSNEYFSLLFSLFRDRVASSELFSTDGSVTEATRGRSMLLVPSTIKASRRSMMLSTLLLCIKLSPGVVQSSNHSPTDDEKQLCRMILRTIHILLNNSRQSSQQRSLAHSFCSANEIYPSLVSLTKESFFAPIATAIIGNMLEQGGLVHGANHNSVLIDACTVAWQIHEERLDSEEEEHQSEETGARQASSHVSTREKRHKVSKSSHKKVGAAGVAIPKQQLQIERSPKRKRSHTDMTSPVPQNSLLSRREFRAADSSPASSIARIIDEALIEASNITRDANASKKNGGEGAVNSAVLSAITARSISIMGGAFNLVIRLCRGSADSIRCSAVKDTADTLLRTLTMVANAVKHGAMAPSDNRAVGPNRLKRALNVLIGVGFELHAVDGGRDEVFGEIENNAQLALRTISQCAIDVWTQSSSLLEQQRDRENDRGRATAGGPAHILDSFDTSLEDRHIQHERSLSRHCCRGSCVALFSSFGVPVSDALCSRCFCSMLPSEMNAVDERLGRSLADDAALFFVELELPLSSRCLLLASICPHKGNQNRLNDEPNTLSSMRKILSTPAGEQSGLVTASALACVPFCISTNAQKPSSSKGSQIDSKNVIQMITKLGLHRSVAAIAFPPSEGRTNLMHPPALQHAAVVCLHRLLEVYVSPPSIEDSGGSSSTNAVSSCVINLVSSYSTLQKAKGKSAAVSSQISAAAFDLLVSPMMVSKQDFACLPSQVRLALWKFLAFACSVCSPSQLRRSNGHSHLVSYRLAASENHPESGQDAARDTDEGAASDTVRTPSLLWLLHAAFADEDGIVRDYAATEIGSALRLEAGCNPLFSLTLNDVEWQAWAKDPVGTSNKFTPAVVERLFREIDSLLHKFCYINESQLSYTFAGTITSTVGSTSSGGGGGEGDTSAAAQSKASMALSRQISALKGLSSICRQVDLDTSLGKALFEHSLLHIVRLWISPNSSRVGVPTPVELRVPGGSVLASVAWDEICKIDRQHSLCSFLTSEASMQRYTATLFSEILVGSEKQDTQDPIEIERHIVALMQFIRAFLIDAIGDEIKETHAFANTRRKFIPRRKDAYSDILRFVQMYFPEICATLILDKDMKALKMFCFFQRFILDEGSALRREENSKSVGEKIQGGKTWHRSSVIKDIIKKMDLNRAMIEHYAAPDFAKAALTRVLLKPQSDALYFYVRTILGDTLSLVQVFAKPYKIHVLDKIVYELGKYDIADVRKCLENGPGSSSCSSYSACFALKRLGLIQDLQDKTNDDETNAIGAMKRLGAVHTDASRELGLEAAKKLVTIRMMSLLVQNFMDQWSDESGLHLVRSLQALLLFVREEESPTYLTQVTQVISKAMATSSSEMHLVAVSTLSDYVQMVLKHNVKLIGDNLSNIIVTIFPVFEVDIMHRQVANKAARPLTVGSSGSTIRSGNGPTPSSSIVSARVDGASSDPVKARTVDEAVKLLNHLVDGKVGKKLAPYFSEIPFLPSNPALEGVRSSLKKLGVDIDEVVPMSQLSTQRTQDGFTGGTDRDGTASVSSFAGGDGATRSNLGSQAQAALRRRLGVLSKLLAHENRKVRIAVLHHLTDLLRANRALFLRLVESEESVSMRFLTVIKDASPNDEAENDAEEGDLASVGGGGVTEIVQKLVSRCIIESDAGTRLALATCLGEMGAIDSNRLGREVNATSAALLTTDSFDVSGFHGSWRLSQPPWKSQVIRYELHLVTHQLVMSLKGAKDNMGQHKVAFTIQELLKLLDESAAKLNASSKPQQVEPSDARSSSSGGPGRQREMGGWLSGKLEEAGVREVLEPYWKTQYRQKELLSPRLPPFFAESGSYFGWLRDWCRYMVARAYHSKRSRWKDFFFACRSAIREDSTVCEFLLPLLVLDNLSFDDESDGGQAIIKEMLDALTFTGSTSDMPLEERTKACNAVFVILDTLSLWSEKETEERNKSSRGSSSASSSPSMSYLAGSDTEWPAEESLASIDDLLKAIPLSLCAEAAEAVGMNARSLRYLELEARSHIAGPIYDDLQVENYRRHYSNENEFHAFSKKGTLLGKTILKGVNTKVVRKVLGCLGDNATMTAISKDFTSGFYEIQLANIQEREFHGDWEGALQMYEQALQLHEAQIQRGEADAKRESEALSLRSGMVKCLLELGQLESALNQTKGILSKGVESRQETSTGASRKRDRLPSYEEIDENARKMLMPSAAEAAWRLGKWDALDDIVTSWDSSPSFLPIGRNQSDGGNSNIEDMDPRSQYGISFGQAMLGLQKGDADSVTVSLEAARTAALQSLSGAARESYSRAYPFLLQLQCIREVEDANDLLRSSRIDASDDSFSFEAAGSSADFANLARSDSNYGWEWGGRLRMADSGAQGSSSIVNTRLALSRIFDNPILEGELWLEEGKRARKSGLPHIAENSLAHADAAFEAMATMGGNLEPSLALSLNKDSHDVQVQFAKLKAATGKTTAALQLLGQERIDIKDLLGKDDHGLKEMANAIQELRTRRKKHGDGSSTSNADVLFDENVKLFGRSLLTGTEWICESGLKNPSEILDRYELVAHRLLPRFERSHFCFAKYLDSLLTSRIEALSGDVSEGQRKGTRSTGDDEQWTKMMRTDVGCQKYLLQAMEEYGRALQLGTKHVYQALPRLLSLWFEFTSIDPRPPIVIDDGGSRRRSSPSTAIDDERVATQLENMQAEANNLVAGVARSIPAIAFYTALPQLISRVGHRDGNTSEIVILILKRLLVKFPQQTMWSVGWLRNSANLTRAKAGEEIFRGAQKNLREKEDFKKHDLIEASKALFVFLLGIAKHKVKNDKKNFTVQQMKLRGADLSEFVPPVQAALSVLPSSIGHSRSSENFPAFVPRMRAISTKVTVMQSKAKPKKITVYAIPAGQGPQLRRSSSANGHAQSGDAGEMHFLVKQEVRGDLRKDARVQDLNNVINRLLSGHGMGSSSSSSSGGEGSNGAQQQRRRLHLRTFSVTCLSEDCGILEWVPNTDSLRNVVMNSYNAQADPHSTKRRGRRIGNFVDPNLRRIYEKCQDLYFKGGNLTRAVEMFDEKFLSNYPPVMYWWFIQNFLDPHSWFEARMAFTLSAATWSAVGHVIGLGDRHAENILIDTSSGGCVHVDFDCIFDKALLLPKPEVVPFRLSPNMLDAFGPVGADGAFTGGMISAMTTLRNNRDILLSVLEPFIKDPIIDWKKHRNHQKQGTKGNAGTSKSETETAKRHIRMIQGRLKGVYNLENPNHKKIVRNDIDSLDQADDMTHLLPLSVEGQVQKMIAEATSIENLVQVYIGWMPWL